MLIAAVVVATYIRMSLLCRCCWVFAKHHRGGRLHSVKLARFRERRWFLLL